MDTKPEIPAYYGFTDVHGFKDFLVAVLCEAPDMFMEMDWLPPEEQMNLGRAFEGLRLGFDLVEWEFDAAKAAPMRELADEALAAYQRGDDRGGQAKLEAVRKTVAPTSYAITLGRPASGITRRCTGPRPRNVYRSSMVVGGEDRTLRTL